ncbi:MAG: alpha/beta hydrolase [Acidobacteriota bacterium]
MSTEPASDRRTGKPEAAALPLLLLGLWLGACATSRSTLPELSAGWQRHSAHLGDQPVHWVTAGRSPGRDRPTLLFIHGSPGTWEAWRGFLDDRRLGSRACLIAVDRPGFGLSGRGAAEPSLARQAAAVARALVANGHGPTLVIGL